GAGRPGLARRCDPYRGEGSVGARGAVPSLDVGHRYRSEGGGHAGAGDPPPSVVVGCAPGGAARHGRLDALERWPGGRVGAAAAH
ncbi:TPA: hypothetical protein ACX6DP_003677, partial [Vibrio cholerae]